MRAAPRVPLSASQVPCSSLSRARRLPVSRRVPRVSPTSDRVVGSRFCIAVVRPFLPVVAGASPSPRSAPFFAASRALTGRAAPLFSSTVRSTPPLRIEAGRACPCCVRSLRLRDAQWHRRRISEPSVSARRAVLEAANTIESMLDEVTVATGIVSDNVADDIVGHPSHFGFS